MPSVFNLIPALYLHIHLALQYCPIVPNELQNFPVWFIDTGNCSTTLNILNSSVVSSNAWAYHYSAKDSRNPLCGSRIPPQPSFTGLCLRHSRHSDPPWLQLEDSCGLCLNYTVCAMTWTVRTVGWGAIMQSPNLIPICYHLKTRMK